VGVNRVGVKQPELKTGRFFPVTNARGRISFVAIISAMQIGSSPTASGLWLAACRLQTVIRVTPHQSIVS